MVTPTDGEDRAVLENALLEALAFGDRMIATHGERHFGGSFTYEAGRTIRSRWTIGTADTGHGALRQALEGHGPDALEALEDRLFTALDQALVRPAGEAAPMRRALLWANAWGHLFSPDRTRRVVVAWKLGVTLATGDRLLLSGDRFEIAAGLAALATTRQPWDRNSIADLHPLWSARPAP